MSLRILYATAELYPYVKTGGLGDVAAGLPPALIDLGADIRYLLPGYPDVLTALKAGVVVHEFLDDDLGLKGARLLRGHLPGGQTAYVLDAPRYFHRNHPYLTQSGRDWPDNHLRFGAFCYVAAHVDQYDRWWQPDIVHGHDWHCGLIPAYLSLRAEKTKPAGIITIHNISYQGLFPAEKAKELHIPPRTLQTEGCEYYGKIGFLKSGLHFADAVTTVSPTYAQELLDPRFGCGLEGLLRRRAKDFYGIVNGIDMQVWNPASDAEIASRYTARRLSGKTGNKRALVKEFSLKNPQKNMLVGIVSRLTPQKGIYNAIEALPAFLEKGLSVVILGTGDAEIEQSLEKLAARYPRQLGLRIGYDEALAHRIIAGADAVLMPSVFEPCGLVQLYAQRYGTVPIVQCIGGLADTVQDSVTGFSYQGGASELGATLQRALQVWHTKKVWKEYQRAGMSQDWSWQSSARHYLKLYETTAKRTGAFRDGVKEIPITTNGHI